MTDSNGSKRPARQASIAHGLGAAVGGFLVGTLAIAVTIYLTGGETVAQGTSGRADLSLFEVTNAAAFSMASAVVSLVMGLIGMVTAAGAAILGLAVGAAGVAGAVVVGLGVVTGPVLLAAAIGLVIKRRFFPDVI